MAAPVGGRPTATGKARGRPAAVGRAHHVVVDCPDPAVSARFWSAVLGLPGTYRSADFVVVAASEQSSGWAFQRAPDHRPPTWPSPDVPQQMHLDVMVDDLAAADAAVRALGARPLPGGDFVYADPAGHPFCLIRRPPWAPPVDPAAAFPSDPPGTPGP